MKIRYTNTIADLVAFNSDHLSRSPAARWARLWAPLGVAVLALVAGIRIGHPAFCGTFVLFFLLFHALVLFVGHRLQLRKMLNEGRNRSLLCEHVLEITPEFLVETTPVSEHRVRWEAVERVEARRGHLFVYVQAVGAHVIPRNAIVEGDLDAFEREVRTRTSKA